MSAVVVALGQLVQVATTIPISTTSTPELTTEGLSLVGIQLPATFTGTAVSFTVATALAANGGTYQELDNASGKVSYTVSGGKYIAINPQDFYGVLFFKIVSNATELAARALTLSLKGI